MPNWASIFTCTGEVVIEDVRGDWLVSIAISREESHIAKYQMQHLHAAAGVKLPFQSSHMGIVKIIPEILSRRGISSRRILQGGFLACHRLKVYEDGMCTTSQDYVCCFGPLYSSFDQGFVCYLLMDDIDFLECIRGRILDGEMKSSLD